MKSFEQLIRPEVVAMEEYPPVEPTEVISKRLGIPVAQIAKLDANENPYGILEEVKEALAKHPYFHIYPDPLQRDIRAALAQQLQVPEQNIIAGSGIDELLDYLCRMFQNPGDAVVNLPPTFGMYPFDSQLVSGEVISVARQADYNLSVPAIRDAIQQWESSRKTASQSPKAKLLFVASPNNPTGNLLSDADLLALLTLDCMIVLDEAYIEFANQPSRVDWVLEHPNLIVLRTFSKAAGMAGLRLGYGVFPDWLCPHLWKFKQPYNINVAASVAGMTCLAHFDKVQAIVERMNQERSRLFAGLRQFDWLKPFPSESNFILSKVIHKNALEVKKQLEQKGILIRYYSSKGLEDCIRISVGTAEHTDRILAALGQM